MRELPADHRYGTRDYDKKYGLRETRQPRSVVRDFVESYVTPGSTVLDLGSGDGRHSRLIAKHGAKVIGIDRSRIGIEKTAKALKEYRDSSAMIGDVHALPLPDHSVDAIICNRVLDYNDDQGLREAFKEAARVLKDDQVMFLTVRSRSQAPKEYEQLSSENEFGGQTYITTKGGEEGALAHYFTQQEILSLSEAAQLMVESVREDQWINEQGEEKFEWQVVLKRSKRISLTSKDQK